MPTRRQTLKAALWAAASAAIFAGAAVAGPKVLTPANPQPSRAQLTQGLQVSYATAMDIKALNQAESAIKRWGKPGKPLRGLDYADTQPGENALTSQHSQKVAAQINGYIHFDRAGVYDIDFVTNDGVRARIGGQRVGYFDGRQTCQATVTQTVQVPQAGWYEVDILWFQRLQTSCLNMRWGPEGSKLKWVPNSAFGY